MIAFKISNIIKLDKSDGTNCIPKIKIYLSNWHYCSTNLLPLEYFCRLWKQAIIPTYEKGSKLECSNQRPISLLSNIDNSGKVYISKTLQFYWKKKNSYIYSKYVFDRKTQLLVQLLFIWIFVDFKKISK